MKDDLYLVLENGEIFKGQKMGYYNNQDVISEIVFSTNMNGYIETLTDPSYYGQGVVQTFPLIGNYGIITDDFESDGVYMSAYIVGTPCEEPSNFRSEMTLDKFLRDKKIVGISGIDTRALTKIIREYGTQNGLITTNIDNIDFDKIKSFKIENAVKTTGTDKSYVIRADGDNKYKVALIDYGFKRNIARELTKRGCSVTVMPATTDKSEIEKGGFDGIMLSNGPGDPMENTIAIHNLSQIRALGLPIFGICLGHQLLALSHGFKTGKLKYGHRGANQPVINKKTKKCFITSQNHSYEVMCDSVNPEICEISYINVNDKSCEGLKYTDIDAFSVQYHPEACGGPHDTSFLFDEFINMMEEKKNAIK